MIAFRKDGSGSDTFTANWYSSGDYRGRIRSNYGNYKLSFQQTGCETTPFFRWQEDYQRHSDLLADVLNEWNKKIAFTSCEYRQGRLNWRPRQEPHSIPYFEQMKTHLQVAYVNIVQSYDNIEL